MYSVVIDPNLVARVRQESASAPAAAAPTDFATQFLAVMLILALFSSALTIHTLRTYSLSEALSVVWSLFDGKQHLSRDQYLNSLAAADRSAAMRQLTAVAALMPASLRSSAEGERLMLSIVRESHRAQVDPLYIAAVVRYESHFDKHAISSSGAMGLMQILPSTGRFISQREQLDWQGESALLHKPEYNLRLGIAYLKQLEQAFKSREHALIAYNWGPANLMKAFRNEKQIPNSSRVYARNIMAAHKGLKLSAAPPLLAEVAVSAPKSVA
jgi:Transglycosylase SLT domain